MSRAADPMDLARAAVAGTKGGPRPGAGRKPGSKDRPGVKREYVPRGPRIDDLLGDLPLTTPRSGYGIDDEVEIEDSAVTYACARADKEVFLAGLAEIRLKEKRGEYLPREEYLKASAKAHQTVAQSLRAIPDTLERKLGVTPELAQQIGDAIEIALGELSVSMEEFFNAYTLAAKEAEKQEE